MLPEPIRLLPGVVLPLSWVRVRGDRAYVSGHARSRRMGAAAGPLGKVGSELTLEQGHAAARHGARDAASLKREFGALERVTAWLRVFGMVNAAPDCDRSPLVIKASRT